MEIGWVSLLPPLVAIGLAILSQRVILSLAAAVLAAVLIHHLHQASQTSALTFNQCVAMLPEVVQSMVFDHLGFAVTEGKSLHPIAAVEAICAGDSHGAAQSLAAITGSDHLRVFYFTMLFGALVGILHAGGSMRSVVRKLSRSISTRASGQTMIWFSGLLIFFDDYANTLLVGTTMQSTADRLRISREKLAYIVDSTAAPVAGLSLISTWVASEINLMDQGLAAAGSPQSLTGFDLFLFTLPYRFYPIFALALVLISICTNRDFAAMRTCEQNALLREESQPSDGSFAQQHDGPAWIALVSVSLTIGTIIYWLYRTGHVDGDFDGNLQYWVHHIGNADPYASLIWGALIGSATALLASWMAARQSLGRLLKGAVVGMNNLLPAMAVLILAWSLSRLTTSEFLDTQGYLGQRIRDGAVPVMLLPTFVFVVSGAVAFCTGTSWGTMGLLIPMTIPVVAASGGDPSILYAASGAVLSGAIFGDHCSPISDTTVLSSQACQCDHLSHVRTQFPYAILAAAAAILCGTLPAAWGCSPYLLLALGPIAMLATMRLLAKPVEQPHTGDLSDVNSR